MAEREGGGPTDASAALRVLVVEDYEDNAQTLALLAESDGHTVQIAYDGPTALEAARVFLPDVVFLDIGLPGMTGYEVAVRLRQEPACARTFIVALTGWSSDSDRQRSAEAGIDLHLTKPFEAADVRNVLAQARSRR